MELAIIATLIVLGLVVANMKDQVTKLQQVIQNIEADNAARQVRQ